VAGGEAVVSLKRSLILLAGAAALALPAAPARAADPLLMGDRANASTLWRLHCTGCHGDAAAWADPTPLGKQLGAKRLRDAALLASRSDDDLIATLLKGGPGPGSPALVFLSPLDAADLVAWLRTGLPRVEDLFEGASAYHVKKYPLAGPGLARAEALAGVELDASERELAVFTVYGTSAPALGPKLVPQEPVALDTLSPKDRRGWVVYGELKSAKGEALPVALALAGDFSVARLLGAPGLDLSKVAPAVVGKGGREPGKRKAFLSKVAPEQASALTRLYARAVEAAAVAFKEEADRHLFDPPEPTAKGAAPKP
jgi:uncharacterized protein YqcC (DUF446 family)